MRTLPRRPEIPDLLEPEAPVAAPAPLGLVAPGRGRPRRRRGGRGRHHRRQPRARSRARIKLTGEAKTFTLEDVRAGRPPVALEALRGKPVVLNFFASWCGPCIREMPALQAMAERYKGKVHFVGVTFNDRREAAQGRRSSGRV